MSEPIATVAAAGPRGMVTIRGDLGSKALQQAATKLSGTAFPGQGEACLAGEAGLLWMSPDELLLMLPHDRSADAVAALGTALKGQHHLAVDVSDARAVFSVQGPGWREVMAKLTPADLHPDAFGPGRVRRTRLAQVACAVWMTAPDAAEVVTFRSVATYAEGLLRNAARPGSAAGLY